MNTYKFLGTVKKIGRDKIFELVDAYWELQAERMCETMNDNTFTSEEMEAQYAGDAELCLFKVETESTKYMEVLCMNQTGWDITKQTIFIEE
tara:strand:+ start:237 stop:512 length:276 start_codon:yes stop_codon:yes gene_type:complete